MLIESNNPTAHISAVTVQLMPAMSLIVGDFQRIINTFTEVDVFAFDILLSSKRDKRVTNI